MNLRGKCLAIGLLVLWAGLTVSGSTLAEGRDREFYLKLNLQNSGLEDDFDVNFYGTKDNTKFATAPKFESHNGVGLAIGQRIGRFAGELSMSRTKLPASFRLYQQSTWFSDKSDCDQFSLDFKYYFNDPAQNPLAFYGLLGASKVKLAVDGNVEYQSGGVYAGSDDSTFEGYGLDAGVGLIYQFGPIALDATLLQQDLRFNRIKIGGTKYKPESDIKSSGTLVRLGVLYRF